MTVRIVKNHHEYKRGDVLNLDAAVALGLVVRGIARIDRMYTPDSKKYKVK